MKNFKTFYELQKVGCLTEIIQHPYPPPPHTHHHHHHHHHQIKGSYLSARKIFFTLRRFAGINR